MHRAVNESLTSRVIALIPELAKFGVVGGIGAVVDLGGAGVLYGVFHLGPITSKAISVTVATVITYLGNRFWTFRHRQNHAPLRSGTVFVALNIVGLLIAEAVIAIVVYGLGFKGHLAYNAASVLGTGFGTIFRYFSYKKWVFLPGVRGVPADSGALRGMPDGPVRPSDPREPPQRGWTPATVPGGGSQAAGGK